MPVYTSKSRSAVRTQLQPLFKWTGSKQRLLEQYQPHFFPEGTPRRFVDLFAGGLTTTLWVAERFPDTELVINDVNGELVHLYRTLAADPDGVLNEWQKCVDAWLPLTPEQRKALYYVWRDEYCLHPGKYSDAYLAGHLMFMLQTNFNGMWKAYAKCNRRYSTPPGTCTQGPAFFQASRLRAVAELLARPTTVITSVDFADVPVQEGDYLYADPPYRDSIVEYQGGFTENDQVRLADLLTSHNGIYAYSNKDIGDGFYERHFPGANIIPIDATYTAGRGTSVREVSEVLVTNFAGADSRTVQDFLDFEGLG